MNYTYGPAFCKKNYVDRLFSFFSRVFEKWRHDLKNGPNSLGPRQWNALTPTGKPEDRAVLGAPTELGGHLLAFGSTIGAYLLAKDEGQTPTELRERED